MIRIISNATEALLATLRTLNDPGTTEPLIVRRSGLRKDTSGRVYIHRSRHSTADSVEPSETETARIDAAIAAVTVSA